MLYKKAVVAVLFLFGSALAAAQLGLGSSQAVSRPARIAAAATYHFSIPFPATPVTGAPFSAVREYEHNQTLADGTHISQKNVLEKIWRDGDGRMRSERFIGTAAGLPGIVEITDPLAGYRYTLDEQNKVAHRMAIPQRTAAPPAPPPPPHAQKSSVQGSAGVVPPNGTGISFGASGDGGPGMGPGPRLRPHVIHGEDLGSKTIEGVMVDGRRTTFTVPAGQEGNDRPITTISDTWMSPELHERIEYITSDPRRGQTIEHLTNIDRNNLDPSLFQVPPDYQIVDEQVPFSINYTRPQKRVPPGIWPEGGRVRSLCSRCRMNATMATAHPALETLCLRIESSQKHPCQTVEDRDEK